MEGGGAMEGQTERQIKRQRERDRQRECPGRAGERESTRARERAEERETERERERERTGYRKRPRADMAHTKRSRPDSGLSSGDVSRGGKMSIRGATQSRILPSMLQYTKINYLRFSLFCRCWRGARRSSWKGGSSRQPRTPKP